MTVEECYARIGNYDEVLLRLGKESYILKYLNRFRQDSTFSSLCSAVEKKDTEQAFLHAHNLKGMYMNLAMTGGVRHATLLCDALRGQQSFPDVSSQMKALAREQGSILEALSELLDSGDEEGKEGRQ